MELIVQIALLSYKWLFGCLVGWLFGWLVGYIIMHKSEKQNSTFLSCLIHEYDGYV